MHITYDIWYVIYLYYTSTYYYIRNMFYIDGLSLSIYGFYWTILLNILTCERWWSMWLQVSSALRRWDPLSGRCVSFDCICNLCRFIIKTLFCWFSLIFQACFTLAFPFEFKIGLDVWFISQWRLVVWCHLVFRSFQDMAKTWQPRNQKSHSDSSVGVMARSWQIPLAWDVQIPSICDLAAYDNDIIWYLILPDVSWYAYFIFIFVRTYWLEQ